MTWFCESTITAQASTNVLSSRKLEQASELKNFFKI